MAKNYITNAQLDKVWKHIETTNHELGEVQKACIELKTDMCWIKNDLNDFKKSQNKIQWLIFSSVIITLLTIAIQTALGL